MHTYKWTTHVKIRVYIFLLFLLKEINARSQKPDERKQKQKRHKNA